MSACAGAPTGELVYAHAWLPWLLDVEEPQIIGSSRAGLFDNGAFIGKGGRRWPAGAFTWPPLAELRQRVADLPAAEADPAEPSRPPAQLVVVDGVDIGKLQATLKTEDRAMVQIASNFNCLENPSRSCRPDYGRLVAGYATDATQGPAASFGVPAASLLRAHYAFHDPSLPPETWGQTAERQVDLLEDVRKYFGPCVNGKATLSGDEEVLKPEDEGSVYEHIRVGLHTDAEVVFGRCGRDKLEVCQEPFAVVDQVLSASINWGSTGAQPSQEQLESLTRAALRAAYDGAYLAAISRRRRLLLLTLVGGGSFRNPEPMILKELAAAHARWASHPASTLEEVRLCLYPRGEAARTDKALRKLLKSP